MWHNVPATATRKLCARGMQDLAGVGCETGVSGCPLPPVAPGKVGGQSFWVEAIAVNLSMMAARV